MNNRSIKKNLIVGAAYLCCVAMIIGILISSVSVGKYTSDTNGYMDFDIGEFKGMVYYLKQEETLEEGDDPVFVKKKFGYDSELHISGCLPGMEQKSYPFIVANGSAVNDFAGSDIECTIRIRTMGNIPLKYKLKYGGNVFDSCQEPERIIKKDKYSKIEDAVWYEYTFYNVIPGTDGADDTIEEAVFDFNGGSFSAGNFELLVDWPIETPADGEDETETNNIKYMKEVEILEVLATLTSKNHDDPGDSGEHTTRTYGVIFLDPAHCEGDTVYSRKYVGDYRALTYFENIDPGTEEIVGSGYEYYFTVNNGNNLYNDGVLTTSHTMDYIYYTINLVTPYDAKTKDVAFTLLQVNDPEEPIIYSVLSTEYRKYDMLFDSPTYGQYSVVTQADADMYIAEHEDDTTAEAAVLQYRFYRVDSFCLPDDGNEAVEMLTNAAFDESGQKSLNGFSANDYCLLVDDSFGDAMQTLLADCHSYAETQTYNNPVDYKFELWFSAVESDQANSPDAPIVVPNAFGIQGN